MRALWVKLGWAGVFAAQALVASCSDSTSSSVRQPDASSSTDSGGDVSAPPPQPDAGPDAAMPCTTTLAEFETFSRCPAAYATNEGPEQLCDAGLSFVSFGSADGFDVVEYLIGASSTQCVYSSSDGTLVGIEYSDDVPDLCNGTSFTESAGVAPPTGVPFHSACSATDAGDGGDAGDANARDAGDGSITPGDGSTGCTGDLATLKNFAGCADSYSTEAGTADLCDAGATRWADSVATGDGLTVVSLTAGAGSSRCIYRSTDGVLVGVWAADDVPDFCNSTSYVETAGVQAPPAGSTTTMSCHGTGAADGGSDAGG